MYGNPKLDEWLKKMESTSNESATSEKTASSTSSEKTETVGAEEKRSA